MEEAFNARQLDDVLALYEPDAVRACDGAAPALGHSAIAAMLERDLARGTRLSLRLLTIAHGAFDLVLITGRWAAERDSTSLGQGTCHMVLRRQRAGSWRLLIEDHLPGRAA